MGDRVSSQGEVESSRGVDLTDRDKVCHWFSAKTSRRRTCPDALVSLVASQSFPTRGPVSTEYLSQY